MTPETLFQDINVISLNPAVATVRLDGTHTAILKERGNGRFACAGCTLGIHGCKHVKSMQAWALQMEVDFEESSFTEVDLDQLTPLTFNGVYPLALEESTVALLRKRFLSGFTSCFPLKQGFPRLTSPDPLLQCPSCLVPVIILEKEVMVFGTGWSGKCKGWLSSFWSLKA